MIFEIKEGLFVDSDEIRSIRYFQASTPALQTVENSWLVVVDIKGSASFAESHLTEKEARILCTEYVSKWRAAKEQGSY